MSVPFEEVKGLLQSWETTICLPCSVCEEDRVVFRAEYDGSEGKRPTELLSGEEWDLPDGFRHKLSPVISFLPRGKFTVCHRCASPDLLELFKNLSVGEPEAARTIIQIASAIRYAA